MRVIVASSRSIDDEDLVARAVAGSGFPITEVVSGVARGLDGLGERHGITVRRFRADWRRHGRGAGRVLNEAMAGYADALVAVHAGSPGTADMIRRMRAAGKPVREVVVAADPNARRPLVPPAPHEIPIGRRTFTMIEWEVPGVLARTCRPGYDDGRRVAVSGPVISAWCAAARAAGVRSILCLLAPEHLDLYAGLSRGGLLGTYQAWGFAVAHLPAADHKRPPLDAGELDRAWEAFRALPKPVLVHCSAGIDRTGAAVAHILAMRGAGASPES